MEELPLVIGYAEREMPWEEREELLQIAVGQLPVESQKLFTGLTSDFVGDGEKDYFFLNLPPLVGIMLSNAGSLVDIGGHDHIALFPETVAIMNNHCTPK